MIDLNPLAQMERKQEREMSRESSFFDASSEIVVSSFADPLQHVPALPGTDRSPPLCLGDAHGRLLQRGRRVEDGPDHVQGRQLYT